MERPIVEGMEGIGLSPNLWRSMPTELLLNGPDVGAGWGFFDHFLRFGNTSLYDGHIILATGSGTTVAQIDSEATAPGIVQLTLDGDGANDEAVFQTGNGLDVGPFIMSSYDFVFEARVRFNAYAIVASKASYFIGMATGGAAGAAITDLLFTDSGGALYGTNSFVGFQKLYAESTALDGMYQASGQTKVDGAVNTDLNAIKTLVAATWVKLGLRYQASPRKLTWFVDGDPICSIGKTALDAAAFPDAVYLQPTIGCKDVAGSSNNITLDIDWWAAAQSYGPTTSITLDTAPP
jgi:hypothetical protein